MGIFHKKEDRWALCKRMTQPVVATPKSVQDSVPIYRVAQNGVFEIEKNTGEDHLFDKAYHIEDVNFATKDNEEKTRLLLDYCETLNSLQTGTKIVIANHNRNLEDIRQNVFLRKQGSTEIEREISAEYNQNMEEKLVNKMSGLNQVKYLVVTCRKKTFGEANVFFSQLENHLTLSFKKLGSDLRPLDGVERLKSLHAIYRMGSETEFASDWGSLTTGTFKGNICPMGIKRCSKDGKDYLKIDGKYVCVLSVKKGGWPIKISDQFMSGLSNLPFHTLIAIDIAPIPQDVAMKRLVKNLDNVEMKIQKQQEIRNKNKQWSSEITYEVRHEKDMIERSIDQMNNNGQKLFHAQMLVAVYADSEEELFTRVDTVIQNGEGNLLTFTPYCVQQVEAFNTAMPTGAREVNLLTRTLFTNALAGFAPFYVQELYQEGGLFYGVNKLSKKLLVGSRKKLLNGNGWVFGVPGSGKSFDVKMEMGQVYCGTRDDIIVVDPQNEYFVIAKELGGQVINLSSTTENHVNPLDVPEHVENTRAFIAEKSEFVLDIFKKIVGGEIRSTAKSWVDKAVRHMYQEHFLAEGADKVSPTMHDLKRTLLSFGEREPDDLALSLDMFTEGSLNLFAHQMNVKTENRFLVYGLRDLGSELRPLAMLVMIEAIRSRIAYNQKMGKVTWVYVDEAHELTGEAYTAKALERLWKEIRKQGGFMTGITQNITDVLRDKTTRTMLANSEFVTLLNQANVDLEELVGVIDISAPQLTYVTNAESGTGLLKFGNKIIPFDNTIDKDSRLYKMYNTNFHEKLESSQSDQGGEAHGHEA